jgi:hypothetical protein
MSLIHTSRRNFLRGVLNGTTISVGLPLLDCLFDDHGTALAATGAPPPVCFGTWFWGCGLTPGRWEPTRIGDHYDLPPELAALAQYKDQINVFSGMNVILDGRPNITHLTGVAALATGEVPRTGSGLGILSGDTPTIDSRVAERFGLRTRFRSLEVTCTQKPEDTYSSRGGNTTNACEVSPLELYLRLFGPDFKDPGAADFKPDPALLLRKSALSVVADQRAALLKRLGAADRARAEDYFAALRQIELRLALELEKPEPLAACTVPDPPPEVPRNVDIDTSHRLQTLFGELLAHALACGQTRVFHVVWSKSLSMLRKPGLSEGHHQRTHEEPNDPQLGYQPDVVWFNHQSMIAFATMLKSLAEVKEGANTLLDRSLILGMTDVSYAKNHTLTNLPMFTAGSAGGRLKTGFHIQAPGATVNRVGLTVQLALGLPVNSWGVESNQTSEPFSEILV